MNKQQLASRIWESANKMRSKIDPNEYKDYILGFIFYKFLSDKEVKFLKENDYSLEDIKNLKEESQDEVAFIQNGIGYFIEYGNLFSTWLELGKDFSVDNVRVGLSAFSRLISPSHKRVFDRIFNTLETGLSKLGDSSGAQTKAISELIHLIKIIPMDGKQDYDVLGFIYEYLISMFAANAGKKAGEFYTPHEVSVLMSEIVANHLKDKDEIKIYDPTSGSGSLLINIGKSVAKHIDNQNNIKYYAQELKENTYNLTRMNLVMRGIIPDNIVTRNGDTLEDDWPYFDDNNPIETYDPLYVDAVVSNPPYSQTWDPTSKENDPRYANYGLAPKTKADFAFLLHDLFHIKSEGIMTIVLPHGVLFRGEEGEIRKNLIEHNNIDAIIGLPSNIFFGTNISTIIMVLKQKRTTNDVLIVDASKDFVKVGKNNVLRGSDIKKIVDTVTQRLEVEKYSRKVCRDDIRKNDYKLNISLYVDSSDESESWDIYASMFGGIPKTEIENLSAFWECLPTLKEDLFLEEESPYVDIATNDVMKSITENVDVIKFINNYRESFEGFEDYLINKLIDQNTSININKEKTTISNEIFDRLSLIPLVDKYQAYQVFDDEWSKIAVDLEIIQTEGFEVTKKVDDNIVLRKRNGKEVEVQEGYVGRVIPFELIQSTILKEEADAIKVMENRLDDISSCYSKVIETLSEEEKESPVLNDDNDAFVTAEVNIALNTAYTDIESEEINTLNEYITLLDAKAKKSERERFVANHSEVNWANIEPNKDGTFGKSKVNAYLRKLQLNYEFPEESFEAKLVRVSDLIIEERDLRAQLRIDSAALHMKTKETIENLSDEEVCKLLELKWIIPLVTGLYEVPSNIISDLILKVQQLADKYATTYYEVESEMTTSKRTLAKLIDELKGNEHDMKGLSEFQKLLKGE
ncbi:type I restriction-modification system subunit M [Sporosarcina oncorhynchi]|uniref:site-specific DNA-methyltransferase (adenine-specific) n=1 Tax=Sporosarcina oncorhynchi TaxID=3056444 RepID=A0ABZ0L1M5_9BACL|nr:type I restriction-modification system subunit M [Sporosarcina sp. T2O-4]WOV86526.1 type I restriction-modification system subunit M [Sporosarcina sp. T2O-4]